MYRMLLSGVLALLALGSTGCTTLLKQGYYTAVGAQGKFYELKIVNPATLARYQTIRVEPFGNELGPCVPREVITEVNQHTPRVLAESGLFGAEGSQLTVQGNIIHFTGRSGLAGAVGSIVSGEEDCVCRVRLVDNATGNLVGEAVCWGVVKSAARRGASELGVGVGKGVLAWIEKRLPEEEVKARREEREAD